MIAILLCSVLSSRPARAETPFTWSEIGFGLSLDLAASSGLSPYGVGPGFRGGLTLDNGMYFGGAAAFYLGNSEVINGAEEVTDVTEWLLEGGYDWGIGKDLVLRPKLALGVGSWYWERTLLDALRRFNSAADRDVVIALGPELLYDLNPLVVGAELRYHHLAGPRSAEAFSVGVFVGTTLNTLFGKR